MANAQYSVLRIFAHKNQHSPQARLQFADSPKSLIRRNERRAAIAAKRMWLEL